MFLPYEPTYKGIPEAFSIQSEMWSSNQLEWLYSNQSDSAFWTKLWGFRLLICMRTERLRSRGRHSFPYKPAPPLALREHFPFPPKTEDCVSWLSWMSQRRTDQRGADQKTKAQQSRPVQPKADHGGAEQRRLAGEEPDPKSASQPCCFHSRAVSQLSCFALYIVSFFTAPKLRIPIGIKLVPMPTIWQMLYIPSNWNRNKGLKRKFKRSQQKNAKNELRFVHF